MSRASSQQARGPQDGLARWLVLSLGLIAWIGGACGADENPAAASRGEIVSVNGASASESRAVASENGSGALDSDQEALLIDVHATSARDFVLHPQVVESEREAGPRRILSVAPSITELCHALGLGDRLVGRTQYCRYPPVVSELPIVGAYTDINLEAVLALEPELVLITRSSPDLKEKFTALGLPLLELPDSRFEDVFEAARLLGEGTGHSQTASALIAALRSDLQRWRAPRRDESALFVTGPLPVPPRSAYIAGEGSFLEVLLDHAGLSNAARSISQRPWQEVSLEQVLACDPDWLIEIGEGSAERTADLEQAWRSLNGFRPARQGRILSLPNWVLSASPRINLALMLLRRELEPR